MPDPPEAATAGASLWSRRPAATTLNPAPTPRRSW